MTMMPPPSAQQLAMLEDSELTDLAALWRKQALHGVRPAFGVAHALESECRRRQRERGAPLRTLQTQAMYGAHETARHWWSWR
jgi:hypothetical protein